MCVSKTKCNQNHLGKVLSVFIFTSDLWKSNFGVGPGNQTIKKVTTVIFHDMYTHIHSLAQFPTVLGDSQSKLP